MKKLQILGTGCAKCEKLAAMTEQAAKELGQPYELVKIKDIVQIMQMNVMTTPALVVDGVVKVSGKIPSVADIKNLINESKGNP